MYYPPSRLSYPQTDVFVLMYSTISPASLRNVEDKWAAEVRHHCPDAPLVLVGTKTDLIDDVQIRARLHERALAPVTDADAEAVARRIGAARHLRCSAANGDGVSAVFTEAIRSVLAPSRAAANKKSRRNNAKCALF